MSRDQCKQLDLSSLIMWKPCQRNLPFAKYGNSLRALSASRRRESTGRCDRLVGTTTAALVLCGESKFRIIVRVNPQHHKNETLTKTLHQLSAQLVETALPMRIRVLHKVVCQPFRPPCYPSYLLEQYGPSWFPLMVLHS